MRVGVEKWVVSRHEDDASREEESAADSRPGRIWIAKVSHPLMERFSLSELYDFMLAFISITYILYIIF